MDHGGGGMDHGGGDMSHMCSMNMIWSALFLQRPPLTSNIQQEHSDKGYMHSLPPMAYSDKLWFYPVLHHHHRSWGVLRMAEAGC